MSIDLEHLQDHVTLLLAALQARLTSEEAERETLREVAAQCQERVALRELREGLVSTRVFDRIGLSESERQVVWMLAGSAISREVRALLPLAIGEPQPDPTLSAIRLLVYGSRPSLVGLDELAPDASLRRLGIVEPVDGATEHESRQTFAVAPRVLEWLHGKAEQSRQLVALGASIDVPVELAATPGALDKTRELVRAHAGLVVVAGPAGVGRRSTLATAARDAGMALLPIDARKLASEPVALVRQLRAIALECKAGELVPLLANLDAIEEARLTFVDAELVAQITRVLATSGLSRISFRWSRPVVTVELAKPSTAQLAALWSRGLDVDPDEGAMLAARYPLAPALLHHAANAARALAVGRTPSGEEIAAGVRTVLDDKLGQLARRVTITQTWSDIVLPRDQLEGVAELLARVRVRGRVLEEWGFAAKVGKGVGITALFSGPPGTGKTMLASLIARDLGLELYQVDLGRVVSKWIGETEKNLGALFDAAEAGHAVLLFDEADALFGKRTEVKSSNDRHANLETNYLLQRLESYTGICLLTTNHDSHIDPAFQRRLSLHLRIEMPDSSERADLWRAMLPTNAPVAADIDVDDLARRYVMSGGYIRNAVLRAAFVAADRDEPICHGALHWAARREYESMGKIV